MQNLSDFVIDLDRRSYRQIWSYFKSEILDKNGIVSIFNE